MMMMMMMMMIICWTIFYKGSEEFSVSVNKEILKSTMKFKSVEMFWRASILTSEKFFNTCHNVAKWSNIFKNLKVCLTIL